MAVSGLPETCDNHAKCIARLALDMMDMAKNVKMGPEPVVSIHLLVLDCSLAFSSIHFISNDYSGFLMISIFSQTFT